MGYEVYRWTGFSCSANGSNLVPFNSLPTNRDGTVSTVSTRKDMDQSFACGGTVAMYLDRCSWGCGLERYAGLGSGGHGMDRLVLGWDEKGGIVYWPTMKAETAHKG